MRQHTISIDESQTVGSDGTVSVIGFLSGLRTSYAIIAIDERAETRFLLFLMKQTAAAVATASLFMKPRSFKKKNERDIENIKSGCKSPAWNVHDRLFNCWGGQKQITLYSATQHASFTKSRCTLNKNIYGYNTLTTSMCFKWPY